MIMTWSNSMPLTRQKLLEKIILDFLACLRYTSISCVYENVSSSFSNNWIVLVSILGCSSAMWRKVVAFFLPIKSFKTNARDITAASLVKYMSSENSTKFGFNPLMSTPSFGSQRKLNLLTILLPAVLLFWSGAELLNAWSRPIPRSRILSGIFSVIEVSTFGVFESGKLGKTTRFRFLLSSGSCCCSSVSSSNSVVKTLCISRTKFCVHFVIPQISLLHRKTSSSFTILNVFSSSLNMQVPLS